MFPEKFGNVTSPDPNVDEVNTKYDGWFVKENHLFFANGKSTSRSMVLFLVSCVQDSMYCLQVTHGEMQHSLRMARTSRAPRSSLSHFMMLITHPTLSPRTVLPTQRYLLCSNKVWDMLRNG